MMSATSSSSAGPMPRVVRAGVPRRMPEVYQAPLGSRGTELRLVTTPASSRADSALWAGEAEAGGDVGQDQVVVGTAGDQGRAAAEQALGQSAGVDHDLGGVLLE